MRELGKQGGNDSVAGIDTIFKGSVGCYEKIIEWQNQKSGEINHVIKMSETMELCLPLFLNVIFNLSVAVVCM